MATSMEMTVFWDAVLCMRLEQLTRRHNDGSSKHLRNVGQFIHDCAALRCAASHKTTTFELVPLWILARDSLLIRTISRFFPYNR
jgi:hypothetical protein